MKKLFFIAAIASAALVSCTKNEVNEPAAQQEITFTAPIVGHLTKAQTGEVGTSYNKDEQFKVYAWYCEEEAFNPDNAQLYMNAITVAHDATINADPDARDLYEDAVHCIGTIYNKLIELGMAASSDKLDKLATAIEGIINQGAVNITVQEGDTYTIPAGYHNGSGTVKLVLETHRSCRPGLRKLLTISFLRASGWMNWGLSSMCFIRRSAYLDIWKK